MNWKALLGGLAVLWLIALSWALFGVLGDSSNESDPFTESRDGGPAVLEDGPELGSEHGLSAETSGEGAPGTSFSDEGQQALDLEAGGDAPAQASVPTDTNSVTGAGADSGAGAATEGSEEPSADSGLDQEGEGDLDGDGSEDDQEAQPNVYRRRVLREIFEPLEEASERYDRHEDLDKRSLFGEDQKSNQKAIDGLLDDAIEILGLSEVGTVREEIRELEGKIDAANKRLARDRESRLAAPFESELNALEKAVKTSREDYDSRIAENEELVAESELAIVELKQEFRQELREIGVELSSEAVEGLLTTVSGDDFVEMCVVFDNVRNVTVQLQDLTEDAGEALDVARRYYGSYVVLVRIMDRIQKDFVRRVSDEQLPRLKEFQVAARKNIAQAERNLADGGDPAIAKANIRSNQLTIDACELYSEYLVDQAREVTYQNEALQKRLRDAINTYETVQLSSQVAELLAEGQRNFSALLELDLPELRGFENAELQAEFQRLTRELVQP